MIISDLLFLSGVPEGSMRSWLNWRNKEMSKDNCDDCFYRIKIDGEPCFGYSLLTNEVRPCHPGDKCTVKVPRKVKRRKPDET